MFVAGRFLEGAKAAIPVWIAFVPSSIAWGVAAQAAGLSLGEIVFMSAWVYSGPAQFAVLEPLAAGKSSLQVLIAAFLMNLRFLPMSAALAPHFAGLRRVPLLVSCHFISASSFIIPYLRFEQERLSGAGPSAAESNRGRGNHSFFLGVGATACAVWVTGSALGYAVALGVPAGFEEPLKFILPGYFAGLLVAEMRGWGMVVVCGASVAAAIPGSALSPEWGWIAAAMAIATFAWSVEQWMHRASA